jgi:hypothetical protein
MAPLLLSVVAAPLLLAAGALVSVALTRRCFAAADDSFRCTLAEVSGDSPRCAVAWPRRTSYARWVNDGLVVTGGILRSRIRVIDVESAHGVVTATARRTLSGLGATWVELHLRLRDGRSVLLAAPDTARDLVAGPFVAALIPTDSAPAHPGAG